MHVAIFLSHGWRTFHNPLVLLIVVEVLRIIMAALRDVMLSKTLTQSLLWEKYAKLCLAVDEIIYEVKHLGALQKLNAA